MKLFYVNMQYTYSYSVVYSLNRRENCVHIMQVLHQTTLLFEYHSPIPILPVCKLHSTFSIFIVKINP